MELNIKEENIFKKNLFTEMRLVVTTDDRVPMTNESLIQAVTLNENIKSLGLTLTPNDIVKLSSEPRMLDTLYETIKSYVPDISAKPMYPNFPSQVMNMDEAQYRLHQAIHYFSTYGIEMLTGMKVDKGWLPSVEDTEKVKEDDTLLEAKVIKMATLDEAYNLVLNKIAPKTERYTIPEAELVRYVATQYGDYNLSIDITFKENISVLVDDLFKSKDNNDVRRATVCLGRISKHSGDVLDFIWNYITFIEFKPLRTSQKRSLVALLETFSWKEFQENLGLKRSRNLTILRYLSYNKFSKNSMHHCAVELLRNNQIKTWNSKVERLIEEGCHHKVLEFVSERPTMLLRMVMRLLKLGYKRSDIEKYLEDKATSFSMQTLISVCNWSFKEETIDDIIPKHYADTYEENMNVLDTINKNKIIFRDILSSIILKKMTCLETPLENKKVFVDSTIFDLNNSFIETNDKSDEGGYIRSGLAIKIPEHIKVLRFFVYWNDKRCVDIDLHSYFKDINGEEGHVGWDGSYCKDGLVTSGDTTHSDASEFIDIDIATAISSEIVSIENNISLYYGASNFKDIDTIFTGMIAVNNIDEDTKLYNNKNVFFRHDLQSLETEIRYSRIDLKNRTLLLLGKKENNSGYSINRYIEELLSASNATLVLNKEDADIILSLDKTADENNISLIDENYFMDSDK